VIFKSQAVMLWILLASHLKHLMFDNGKRIQSSDLLNLAHKYQAG